MFVLSLRRSKIRAVGITVLVCAICLGTFVYFAKKSNEQTLIDSGINTRASTAAERISFLSQFGWDIDIEPVAVKEITIPMEFNEDYEKFNALQNKQNFDLHKYSGERAKLWTYNVKNYPGYEDTTDMVRANIIIYNGSVIAGDITILDKNGSMNTLDFPGENPATTTASEDAAADSKTSANAPENTSGSTTQAAPETTTSASQSTAAETTQSTTATC